MGFPSIVLTPFAGTYNLFGVGYGGWPIEPLPEGVPDQGPRGRVVPHNLARMSFNSDLPWDAVL